MADIELLQRLCETPGAPGREDRVRELIESEIEGLFDHVETDPMGSLLCRRDPRPASRSKKKTAKVRSTKRSGSSDPTRVMFACHMDEIALFVTHIDDNGFVRFTRAGGFDPRTMFARRVLVCTEDGDLPGVMSPAIKPLHITKAEDRNKPVGLGDFYIDLGMSAPQVKRRVKVGDFIVMDEPAVRMGDKVVAKAIDNRYACWLGIEGIRALDRSGAGHACEIHVAFTVQEEVGLRGAKTSAQRLKPDIGIGVDVTVSGDTPGTPNEVVCAEQGAGVAIQMMDSSFIADHKLILELEAVARKARVKHQRTALTGGGSDTAAMQLAHGGCRVAAIAVGIRYIHTVCEMIDVRDLESAVQLMAAWLPTVK
ncbi:MAG: M20/M25/M40 family metallo-hydrolase [Planctomycetota bacterium]